MRAVQEFLGHASISTTAIYTHLNFAQLAKAYDAAHPRAHRRDLLATSYAGHVARSSQGL